MGRKIYLLTGDIGGTNSRMSLYDCTDDCEKPPVVEKYYRNAKHIPEDCHGHPETFQNNILIPFIKHCWEENDVVLECALSEATILATLATAGTVAENRVNMTNLGNLLVDGTAIERNQKDPYLKHVKVCRIINDFVAVRYTVLFLILVCRVLSSQNGNFSSCVPHFPCFDDTYSKATVA